MIVQSHLKLALVQSKIERHFDDNLRRVKDLVSTASRPDLLVLYENWVGRDPLALERYVEASQEVLDASGSRALVSGSAYVEEGDEIFSSTLIVDRRGLRAFGGKSFPSKATGERDRVSPGGPPAILRTGYGFTIASVVCVDAIYPEVVRYAALRGADIVANPSIVPGNRSYLWRSLGSARAAENTVFFAHVNPTGIFYFDGRSVSGGSFVSDPQGRIFFEVDDSEGVFETKLDLGLIGLTRRRWAYLDDVLRAFGDFYELVSSNLKSLRTKGLEKS